MDPTDMLCQRPVKCQATHVGGHLYAGQVVRPHLTRVSLSESAWRGNEDVVLHDQPRLAQSSSELPARPPSPAGRWAFCAHQSLHTEHLQRADNEKWANVKRKHEVMSRRRIFLRLRYWLKRTARLRLRLVEGLD